LALRVRGRGNGGNAPGGPMSKLIPPLDLLWLVSETPEASTHVGGVMVFQKPRGRPRIVRGIVNAYRRFEPRPPFNYVPEFTRLGWPKFQEALNWDPEYHVQHFALPADSNYEDFLRLVASLHEPVLDRSRPLFRTWLIDGLPGDRFAIYSKVSHAIIDGASGMERVYASLSSSARGRLGPPTFAMDVQSHESHHHRLLADRLAVAGAAATRQAAAMIDVSRHGLRKIASLLSGSAPSGSQPFTARHSPMNAPLGRSRTYATLSLPLGGMRAVGRHFGATLNDMVMTLVDEGAHRYLRQTDRAFPHRLVAMCPMSLREQGDLEAATKVSAMFVHLGEHDAGVVARVGQVAAAMRTAKEEMRSMSKEAAMVYAVAVLGLAQASVASGIGRVAPPLANLVISNVPGAPRAMYLDGARMQGMFAVSAIAASIGLNATVSSYNGSMDFGFVGNGETMPALTTLARHVADAFEDLKAAAARGGRSRRSGRDTPSRRRVGRGRAARAAE
jgi:diacylglycerol O-acyltransferase